MKYLCGYFVKVYIVVTEIRARARVGKKRAFAALHAHNLRKTRAERFGSFYSVDVHPVTAESVK